LSAEESGFEIPVMSSGGTRCGGEEALNTIAFSLFGSITFKPDERLLLPKYHHVLPLIVCSLAVGGEFAVGREGGSVGIFFANRLQILRDNSTVP